MDFTMEGLEREGFIGFQPVESLWKSCDAIPGEPGVYVVLRTSDTPPEFLAKSTCGTYKGKEPTLPVDELRAGWVPDACVLYIGKAGGGNTRTSLYDRVRAYMKMGQGKSAGHFGGRRIWQLADARELVVAWKTTEAPVKLENRMLTEFRQHYGSFPYANRRGPSY